MGKEKEKVLDNKSKEYTFFYEIAGVVCILIALISIARLGAIGKYGMLTFRLLFGDWYFVFLFALGSLGVFFLFVHHRFSIKNIRYLGILLILIALITLSHFSMHHYVEKLDGNKLKNTVLLYLDYFKNGRAEMMVGGGLMGCLTFYLCYYLLSSVGTIIICIIIIFIGIVFISKHTIVDFISIIGGWLTKIFKRMFKFPIKMKGLFGKFSIDYKKKEVYNKQFNQKYLNDNDYNQINQKQMLECTSYLNIIKKTLDHLNIFYQDVTFIVCNHISVFFIVTMQDINYEVFKITLAKSIKKPFLIRYDLEHKMTILEINNSVSISLSLKEALRKEYKGIALGKDDRNEIVSTCDNILIIGNNSINLRYYLSSLMLYPHFLKSTINDFYVLIDLNDSLFLFKNVVNYYNNDLEYLQDLKVELDETIMLINNHNVSTINDYNKINKQKIKKKYIFINGVQKVMANKEMYKILEYLLITGTEIGYQFIITLTDDKRLENELQRIFNYKVILPNNFNITSKYLSYGLLDNLQKDNEGFLRYRDLTIRLSLLLIQKDELSRIKKHYFHEKQIYN
ncbi:MAG: hypothetical protein ACI32E_00595 [Bacilli bacterium]